MMATKGHVEMTYKQYMPDPFKKHLINFETHKEKSKSTLDNKKQMLAKKMVQDSADYVLKREMLVHFREEFGVTLLPREHKQFFNILDCDGLEIILNKKLADKKAFIAAQTIQKTFRGYLCLKWYRHVHQIRTDVALRF